MTSKFEKELQALHGRDPLFIKWHDRCDKATDFRQHVAVHASFLQDQARSLAEDSANDLLDHPLWNEVNQRGSRTSRSSKLDSERTVVTSSVAFSFLKRFDKWGSGSGKFDLFDIQPVSREVKAYQESRRRSHGFRSIPAQTGPRVDEFSVTCPEQNPLNRDPRSFVGKVVAINHIDSNFKSGKTSQQPKSKFALVIGLSGDRKRIRVIWLVQPQDAMALMCGPRPSPGGTRITQTPYFPCQNEFFLVDDCNCTTIQLTDVHAVYEAATAPKEISSSRISVRSLYRRSQRAIVDAHLEQFSEACPNPDCQRSMPTWACNDTDCSSSKTLPILHNISLFSGAGLLDTGLGTNPGIKTVCSVDWDHVATKSIMANTMPEDTHRVHQMSVNVWLKTLLRNAKEDIFQYKETILSAGPPCTGFSLLNTNASVQTGQRPCSLIASVVSAIDILLPNYVIIENVTAMAGSSVACAQIVSILVALGYQVRTCVLNAHYFGSPTKRQRLFIIAAASGMDLPAVPAPTHDVMPDVTAGIAKFITVEDVIGHLPPVHNDLQINVKLPNHIPVHRFKPCYAKGGMNIRDLWRRISPGLSVSQCLDKLTDQHKIWFMNRRKELIDDSSRAFRRMTADGQFDAVLGRVNLVDARGGAMVHYKQDRMVTVEELRCAQGVPSDHVLIGTITQMVQQLGNGVPIAIGIAWAGSIMESWQKSWPKLDHVAANYTSETDFKLHGTDEYETVPPPSDEVVVIDTPARLLLQPDTSTVATPKRTKVDLKTPSTTTKHPNTMGRNGSDVEGGHCRKRRRVQSSQCSSTEPASSQSTARDNNNDSDSDIEYLGTRKIRP